MLPYNIVCFFKSGTLLSIDKLREGGHEFGYLCIGVHARYSVVTACDDTEKLALRLTVLGYGYCGVTRFFLERNNVSHGCIGGYVGVAYYEACLCALCTLDHSRLIFNALRAVNKGNSTLFCKSNGKLFA